MQRHVVLLGILSSLWGALSMLIGLSMLLLAAGALAPLVEPQGPAIAFAAGATATAFALFGAFALLWGGAHVWAGAMLRNRVPLGRLLSLGLAVVNLLVLPFGTAFGAYALWVLLADEGRRVFEPHILSPAAPR